MANKSEVEQLLDKEEVIAPGVSKTDVPFETARRSYLGTSFSPEDRAHRQQLDYVRHMNAVYSDLSSKAKTDEQKTILKEEFKRYNQGYLKHQLEYLASHSRIVSAFIAGPSNFPARQMNKRNDAAQNKVKKWLDWDKKAQKAISRKINPVMHSVSSDRPDAVVLLQKQLDAAETLQSVMVSSNKIIRRKGDSKEGKIKDIIALGVKEETAEKLLNKEAFAGPGFPAFRLSNNNANIKRLQGRIKTIEALKSHTTKGYNFAGGEIIDNVEENRLQIKYDGKPESDTIKKLKQHGFKWSPTRGVWQRMRGENANYSIRQVFQGIKIEKKAEATAPTPTPEPEAVKMPEIKDTPEQPPEKQPEKKVIRPTHKEAVASSKKTAKEREKASFEKSRAKFADEAVDTRTISQREKDRKRKLGIASISDPRSPHAIRIDNALLARKVTTDPDEWAKSRSSIDLKGRDMPKIIRSNNVDKIFKAKTKIPGKGKPVAGMPGVFQYRRRRRAR